MIFIRELKQNPSKYFLPDKFAELFEEYCEECESPMQITEDLAHYRCSNIKCKTNIAAILYQVLKSIGVEDITYEEALGMVKLNNWENPFQFFNHNIKKRYYKQITTKRQHQLNKYVSTGGVFSLTEYIASTGIIPTDRCIEYFEKCKELNDCYEVLSNKIEETAVNKNEVDIILLQDWYRLCEVKMILEKGMLFVEIEDGDYG